ncbi:endonuclease domain-containing protein [Trinickia mobilis]|uniref:endonuclease domain-containing protein n=1 Tax=Trinickia mobilis TaxID=2816356 RepID=UPI001A8F7A3A|nr:DUF559 domain-containing protein [Trinickia mobilis]
MNYPGQPKAPPAWWRHRNPSFIEAKFKKELGDLADAIESETWFGDPQKHSRYRVDFLLKDARLIVELDGHAYHSTREQLEKDAVRQRYLTRAGYSIVRFTGREVNRCPTACVAEVREIYQERVQRSPKKYRVMYIDYSFFCLENSKALAFYRDLHPHKNLLRTPIDKFIPHAIEWLKEKSFITVFLFHHPDDRDALLHLDNSAQEYERGEVRINNVSSKYYSIELGEHMRNYSHLFDDFYLVADDPIYIDPLRSVLPETYSKEEMGDWKFEYLANGKLLRRGNDETSFVGSDLVMVRWQDIWYALGSSMGLQPFEL